MPGKALSTFGLLSATAALLLPATAYSQVRPVIGLGGRGVFINTSPFLYSPGLYGLGGYSGLYGYPYTGYGLGMYPNYYNGPFYNNFYSYYYPTYASSLSYVSAYLPSRSYAPLSATNPYLGQTTDYRSRYTIVGHADTSKARFEVLVPRADAEVWFDGVKRDETGAVRTFTTPSLTPGAKYAYTVRARWQEGNRTLTRSKDVYFKAGQLVLVDFMKRK
jgi:uncharacterized protein (TIGR03000 family)